MLSVPVVPSAARSADSLWLLGWLVSLAAVVGSPWLLRSPTLGDDLTRYTVRLALAYYAGAAALMLVLRPAEWRPMGGRLCGRARLARWCWTLGWATFLVHLGMAFHHYHGWSHAEAITHTEQVSGHGEGIFVSHLYTLLWTLDVAYWWLRPVGYARRPTWVGWALHGFMVFIIFNATVVYETGLIRWAGAAMLASLGGLGLARLARTPELPGERGASAP